MQSPADALPPEISQQIHPDWRKNEAEYWAARDRLLNQYQGQWIGFADGAVIASGTSPVEVFHAAQKSAPHPYVICVGHEEESSRMRRARFAYDTAYFGEALPLVSVEFRRTSGSPGLLLDRVIPDTAADASALPRGGLPAAATGARAGYTRADGRRRRQFRRNDRLSGMGAAGRAGVPVPPASGLCRKRPHLGQRRSEPLGHALSRPGSGSDRKPVIPADSLLSIALTAAGSIAPSRQRRVPRAARPGGGSRGNSRSRRGRRSW